MYTKTRSSVKLNDELSNLFETECGVRQRDVLSATRFLGGGPRVVVSTAAFHEFGVRFPVSAV